MPQLILPELLLREHVVAEVEALVADVHGRRTGKEQPVLFLGHPAERRYHPSPLRLRGAAVTLIPKISCSFVCHRARPPSESAPSTRRLGGVVASRAENGAHPGVWPGSPPASNPAEARGVILRARPAGAEVAAQVAEQVRQDEAVCEAPGAIRARECVVVTADDDRLQREVGPCLEDGEVRARRRGPGRPVPRPGRSPRAVCTACRRRGGPRRRRGVRPRRRAGLRLRAADRQVAWARERRPHPSRSPASIRSA